MKSKNRFIHYVLAAICLMGTSLLASKLGVNTAAVKWVVILPTLLLGVGGINTFFYYLMLFIVEIISFLVLGLMEHSFTTMWLSLIPLAFAILFFVVQVIKAKRDD